MMIEKDKQSKISVVIAAWNGFELLAECLRSLKKQPRLEDAEIIVVSNFAIEFTESEQQFPSYSQFFLSADSTVPQLRAFGIAQSRGEIIAISEDQFTFDSDWLGEIMAGHQQDYSIVGGAVENSAVKNPLDWAVYFYDYGKYSATAKAGITETLSGANVSYKRTVLGQIREIYQDEFFETQVNEELKRRGGKLFFQPRAKIFHNKSYRWGNIVEQFYHQARMFAAIRVAGSSLSRRFFLTTVSIILPLVLTMRVASRTIKNKDHITKLLVSFPALMILMCVWSWGEFRGYLSGEGKSRGKWK